MAPSIGSLIFVWLGIGEQDREDIDMDRINVGSLASAP
jgi:hypothetical protein